MKKLISVLTISLSGSLLLGQNVQFTYGSPITKESISGMSYTNWYNNSSGMQAIAEGFTDQINFLGFYNNHYFIVKNSAEKGEVLLAFSENLKLANAWPLSEHEKIEKSNYLNGIAFQNELCFFYQGNSDQISKGHSGIFLVKLNITKMNFTEPVFIDQYQVGSKIKECEIAVSENENYLALIVNPDVSTVTYEYGYTILDNGFNKIKTESFLTGKFKENHNYRKANISNTGDLYLLFDNYRQEAGGTVGSSFIQKPHQHATCIMHSQDGTRTEKFITFDDRSILNLSFLNTKNEPELFITWFNKENETTTGFSIYSLTDNTENFKYEFDPLWIEPYIKRGLHFSLEDLTVKKNQASNTIVNVFFDLKDVIENDSTAIYVLKKKTYVTIPGGMSETPSTTTVNESNTYAYDGDILIIMKDIASGEISKAKIERSGNSYTEGEVMLQNDGKLNFLYCSTLPEDERSGSDAYLMTIYTCGMYSTSVDLKTMEISTRKIGDYNRQNPTLSSIFRFYSIYESVDDFVVFTYSKEHQRLVRGHFGD